MRALIIIFPIITLLGCGKQLKNDSSEKIKQVYEKEIKETLLSFDNRLKQNPVKTFSLYKKAQSINKCFKDIDSVLKLDNNKLFLNDNLYKIEEIYNSEKFTNDSALKMRFEIIKSAIENNSLNEFENHILLNELNSRIINKLYNQIDANDFKFNKLDVLVVPRKDKINIGEAYEANIYIVASDTTRYPEITYMNEFIRNEGNKGVLQIRGNSPGIKKSSGKIKLRIENKDQEVVLPYDIIFEVK